MLTAVGRLGALCCLTAAVAAMAVASSGCGDADGGDGDRGPTALERATSPRDGIAFEEVVEITASGYRPRNAKVLAGGSVTWINVDPDGPHTAQTVSPHYRTLAGGQDGSFDSHTLYWEEPYTEVFHVPGTFRYGSSFDSWEGTVEVVSREPPADAER